MDSDDAIPGTVRPFVLRAPDVDVLGKTSSRSILGSIYSDGGHRGTVLIVEDELLIRWVIADHLQECGFKTLAASNAEEAIVALQNSPLKIDVVFSDIKMPGPMDGFGLAAWLKQHNPDVAVKTPRKLFASAILSGSLTISRKWRPASNMSLRKGQPLLRTRTSRSSRVSDYPGRDLSPWSNSAALR